MFTPRPVSFMLIIQLVSISWSFLRPSSRLPQASCLPGYIIMPLRGPSLSLCHLGRPPLYLSAPLTCLFLSSLWKTYLLVWPPLCSFISVSIITLITHTFSQTLRDVLLNWGESLIQHSVTYHPHLLGCVAVFAHNDCMGISV